MKPHIEYSIAGAPQQNEPKLRHQLPSGWFQNAVATFWRRRTSFIVAFQVAEIAVHLVLCFELHTGTSVANWPLLATFVLGGIPLVYELLQKIWKREFGSDLLAGISIVTSLLLERVTHL